MPQIIRDETTGQSMVIWGDPQSYQKGAEFIKRIEDEGHELGGDKDVKAKVADYMASQGHSDFFW